MGQIPHKHGVMLMNYVRTGHMIDHYLDLWDKEPDPEKRDFYATKADHYARIYMNYEQLLKA